MQYDTIIVGAGPAGLGAAYYLTKHTTQKILVIDKGNNPLQRKCPMHKTAKCTECEPCNIMCGVGGAGGMSDGKLNLSPYIGGDLTEYNLTPEEAQKLIDEIDKEIWEKYDPNASQILPTNGETKTLKKRAFQAGLEFFPIKQKHIGSDYLPQLIDAWQKELEQAGVKFKIKTIIEDIEVKNNKVTGVILKTKEVLQAKNILLCIGREGQKWLTKLAKKHNIKFKYGHVDIGVRVETRYEIMEDLTNINYDPKIYFKTKKYQDKVRTFCTNPKGWVTKENYNEVIGVNGHAEKGKLSKNTNFALLNRVHLTQPQENSFLYGHAIAKIGTILGGGKVLVQTLGDLRKHRRSKQISIQKNQVHPTLQEYVPGDLSMLFPGRIMENILSAIEQLEALAPGINSDHTLLYGPEIKYDSTKIIIDKNFMTNIQNLFVAGDGAGLSGDIINANATGWLAAKGIMNKSK